MKKTKNILALLLAVAMCFGLMAGCGATKSATASTSPIASPAASAEATGRTFTVGFDASFPPYGYKDDSGNYIGFDLDLAAEVCTRNGWKLVLKPIDWDSKDLELSSGSIDCIWSGFTINGREDKYTWTEPYVKNSQVIVVKKDSGISDLAGLKGKSVLVQADSSALAALTDETNAKNLALSATFKALNQVPDYLTAFMSLDSGAGDAIAMDIGVAEYTIKQRGGNYTILSEAITDSEQYGVGFKLGNTELRDEVQKALDAMAKDGAVTKIADKWGLQGSVLLGK